jgi:hypothetical protein
MNKFLLYVILKHPLIIISMQKGSGFAEEKFLIIFFRHMREVYV